MRPLDRTSQAALLLVSCLLSTPELWAQSGTRKGPIFVDRAADWGLTFTHFNGMSGSYYFPEIAGSGAALFDYDGDGDLDAYLVQGAMLGAGKTLDQATFPPTDRPPRDRLFRNDLPAGGPPRFVDVTAKSGIDARGYGIGVATADYDRDGDVDLYVVNDGPNQLWRNRGDGTFEDATAKAGGAGTGLDDDRWSTAATFFDYDGDGWLDLFVVNYVTFDLEENPRCFTGSSRRDWCGPAAFPPQPDRLLRNRGDGTFENVTAKAGLRGSPGPGLGVVAADFDGDGDSDLFVANDGAFNHLWLNRGNGTFTDDALFAGVAVNRNGAAEASMGVAAGDADGDGDLDLFMTHLGGETNTFYLNAGGVFEDRSTESGLAAPSQPMTGFGTGWLDFDNDGWLDLLAVNGAVRVVEPLARAGDPYPLDQPDQLFRNLGTGPGSSPGRSGAVRFEDVSVGAGEALSKPAVGRGTAFGDVDGDGDTDALVVNNSGAARLLVNQVGQDAAWLGLRVVEGTPKATRDALGARVEVLRTGVPALWRRVATDGSYGSASDPRVLVGLGSASASGPGSVRAVRVHWPDGTIEEWTGLPLREYSTLHRGEGREVKP